MNIGERLSKTLTAKYTKFLNFAVTEAKTDTQNCSEHICSSRTNTHSRFDIRRMSKSELKQTHTYRFPLLFSLIEIKLTVHMTQDSCQRIFFGGPVSPVPDKIGARQ